MPGKLFESLKIRRFTSCFFVIALLASAGAAPQQLQIDAAVAQSARNFKVTDFDYPLPAQHGANDAVQSTSAIAINDAGVIVGLVQRYGFGCGGDCGKETFISSGGKFTLIHGPVFNGQFTVPVAINNRGEVLIDQDSQSGPPRYFVYDIAQKTFGPINPFIQIGSDKARVEPITGLNDQDEFAGTYNYRGHQYAGSGKLAVGAAGSAAVPVEPGAFTQIACPDNRNAVSGGINNKDQVTGYCDYFKGVQSAFFYNSGIVTVFDYPGAHITRGRAINDAGAIVGIFTPRAQGPGAWPPMSFAYDGSQFSALALKPDSHGDFIDARGINNKGEVVGDGAENGSGFTATPGPANPLAMSTNAR